MGWPPTPFMHKGRDGHQNKERLENTAASMRYLLHGMGWPPPPFSIYAYTDVSIYIYIYV